MTVVLEFEMPEGNRNEGKRIRKINHREIQTEVAITKRNDNTQLKTIVKIYK